MAGRGRCTSWAVQGPGAPSARAPSTATGPVVEFGGPQGISPSGYDFHSSYGLGRRARNEDGQWSTPHTFASLTPRVGTEQALAGSFLHTLSPRHSPQPRPQGTPCPLPCRSAQEAEARRPVPGRSLCPLGLRPISESNQSALSAC